MNTTNTETAAETENLGCELRESQKPCTDADLESISAELDAYMAWWSAQAVRS